MVSRWMHACCGFGFGIKELRTLVVPCFLPTKSVVKWDVPRNEDKKTRLKKMIRIPTEKDLHEAFRTIDRDHVRVPTDLLFPLALQDYLAWVEPSGHRTFLVVADPASGKPLGVVFKKTPQPPGAPANMCDWCHSVRAGDSIGLMTVSVDKGHSIGLTLCRDLSCRDKVSKSPGVNDVRESLSNQEKVMRIVSRMASFARKNLF